MLDTLDLDLALEREEYAARRPSFERELFDLVRRSRAAGVSVVIVFEGIDGAGKGRAIYDLTEKLDPRVVAVHPIQPPRNHEKERPWLWRFWMATPARGEISIFDESWYRRVLVERVENEVRRAEWRAAYDEINHLERALVEDGVVLVKCFLYIDKKTQKKRIARAARAGARKLKAWKRRNRRHERWHAAALEMLERTSTTYAPWTCIPACSERFARAKVFETVISTLRNALDERNVPLLAPVAAAAPPPSSITVSMATEARS
jgi:polyphosphate kinase 2 (PPK2 family)